MITFREFENIEDTVKGYITPQRVTIWDLILEFLKDIAPIFIDKDLNYKPVKKYQVLKLWNLSKAVYKFISSLKKL
jgi:hypothetical protein